MIIRITKCTFILLSLLVAACDMSSPQDKEAVVREVHLNNEGLIEEEYLELKANFESLREDYLTLDGRFNEATEKHNALQVQYTEVLAQLDLVRTEKLEMGIEIDGQKSKEQTLFSQLKEQINKIALLTIESSQLQKKIDVLTGNSQEKAQSREDKKEKVVLEKVNEQLVTDLQIIQDGLVTVAEEKKQLEEELEVSSGTEIILEQQLADFITLEAGSANLSQQLSAGLANVSWEIPKTADLVSSFEIIVKADSTPEFNGQIFVAELLTGPSIEFISAAAVEAQVADGQLQWRWRVKGINEKNNAKLDLFIHQNIQYLENRMMRQIYRDQESVSLNENSLLREYGFWLLVILLGLLAGYFIGRVNNRIKAK